jgi:hypothetical protein
MIFPIMEHKLQQALSAAVLKLLKPLVRVLLKHGMAYGTFAELARKAYVDEGLEYLRESGSRPTISGVSALTGLTRKEAKRLNELVWVDEAASSQRYNRATRVISGWTGGEQYLDSAGEPAILPVDGGRGSFTSLVKQFSGDIPPSTMLSLLEKSGTIAISSSGIELLEKAYVPSNAPLEKVNILGTDVAEIIHSIGHNLSASPDDLLFQRKVSNVLLHPDALAAFREMSNEKSQVLLEEYHAWLSQHEVDPIAEPDVPPRYVAVGIYYTEYSAEPEKTP